MAKNRARKKRPLSERQERIRTEPRRGASSRGSNLRRFTLSSWAIAAQALSQPQQRATIPDLLGLLDWLGDSNLTQIKRTLPPLPCRSGCAFCCYVGPERPDLLAPELLRIVTDLREERSAATLAMLKTRLGDAGYGATAEKPACLFLVNERCTIYPVRPMRCRAQNSHDRDACEQHYLGQRNSMPLLSEPAMLYKSVQIGLRLGLRQAGLQDNRLALDAALRIALLEQPDALDQWLAGTPVFAQAVLPEEADEDRLLTHMLGRARGEMRAEAARLLRLTSTLRNRPGAWALYPLTGQVPLT